MEGHINMNYNNFLKDITQRVTEKMGEGYEVEVQPTKKNNGVLLDSMMIRRVDELICPNLYLHHYYEMYLDGLDMDEISDRVISAYRDAMPLFPIDPESFVTKESVRKNVVYRLINYEKNEKLLEEIPHKWFLDLALIYYVMVHADEIGDGAIMVNKKILEHCELSCEELDLAAQENTSQLLPADLVTITDLLREFGEKAGVQSYSDLSLEEELEEETSDCPLYVLTNKERHYGAYYITDMDVLSGIARKLGSDLFILPSSVHECMVVPSSCWDDPHCLAEMVQDINRTQVTQEEFLADTVYRFDSEKKSLEIAA